MKWHEYWSIERGWHGLDKGHGTRMARIRHGLPQSFNIVVGWNTDDVARHWNDGCYGRMERGRSGSDPVIWKYGRVKDIKIK